MDNPFPSLKRPPLAKSRPMKSKGSNSLRFSRSSRKRSRKEKKSWNRKPPVLWPVWAMQAVLSQACRMANKLELKQMLWVRGGARAWNSLWMQRGYNQREIKFSFACLKAFFYQKFCDRSQLLSWWTALSREERNLSALSVKSQTRGNTFALGRKLLRAASIATKRFKLLTETWFINLSHSSLKT